MDYTASPQAKSFRLDLNAARKARAAAADAPREILHDDHAAAVKALAEGTATDAQREIVERIAPNTAASLRRLCDTAMDHPEAVEPCARPTMHACRRVRDRVGHAAVARVHAAHGRGGNAAAVAQAKRMIGCTMRAPVERHARARGAGRPRVRRTSSSSRTSSSDPGDDGGEPPPARPRLASSRAVPRSGCLTTEQRAVCGCQGTL